MMKIKIKKHGNPDYGQNPNKTEKEELTATTIAELRAKVREWQLQTNCGGGNWGVCSVHINDKIVGYMSYNGRIWKEKKWNPSCIEINDDNLIVCE